MHNNRTPVAINAFLPLALAILSALWMFCIFCSCPGAEGTNPNRMGQDNLELRVMSFNIRYGTADDGENRWENRRQIVFDVLREQNSDVVGLQEALRFQIDEIRAALPVYGEIGAARDDGKTEGEYAAILYSTDRFSIDESGTFWFSDTPAVPGSITWGNTCTRICTWARFIEKKSGDAFYIFNLHLDHASQPSREKSAVLLTRRISGRKHLDRFVVTGDFNVGEDNSVMTYLRGETLLGREGSDMPANPVPMVDTFRLLHPDAEDVGTYHGFNGDRKGSKIDYVLASPGVKVLEAQILHDNLDGRYPSDHFPVAATVSFAAGTAYYIDSKTGDDENTSDSPKRPWKTLAAVNARVFVPGDKILFKAGTNYSGLLKPKGSGADGRPIVIDMYGSGEKPRIDGEGIQDTLLLENIEY